ncbi:MAG: glycerate kinase [Desulfomonilaceae bacterium]|nr:glycerate kinase [Desulfomonilaceae bacterium]
MTKSLADLRKDAASILEAGLEAADPERAVKASVRLEGEMLVVGPDYRLDLRGVDRVFIVGGGKASAPMGKAVEDLLGDRITGGVICVKYGHGLDLRRTRVTEGAHPIPDAAGERAARDIIALLESAGERDLVISCISGGGSALLPCVPPGITLQEKQDITGRLLAVGADIYEINAVRKHLSVTKGGNLARFAFPAHVINLMLSDVAGDATDTIASGPFVPDGSTFEQVLGILEKYNLTATVPESILSRLRSGARGEIPETPKEGDTIFEKVKNVIVGSNFLSLSAGEARAVNLGYETILLSSAIEGDTSEAAGFHAAIAHEVRSTGKPVPSPACILSGGETTVVLKGNGKGGRNQHFALSLVEKASRISCSVFLSAGTDGTDGPTDAAGAIVDTDTGARARQLGMDPDDYLRRNDSYNFFQPLGDLIMTGPTRTNVMDVRICLVG